jgi:hypothetical protein
VKSANEDPENLCPYAPPDRPQALLMQAFDLFAKWVCWIAAATMLILAIVSIVGHTTDIDVGFEVDAFKVAQTRDILSAIILLACAAQFFPDRVFIANNIFKYLSIFLTLILITSITLAVVFADKLSPNQATVLGNGLTAFAAFPVLAITLSRENRIALRKAKSSAKMLESILKSIYFQIERINNGSRNPIILPDNVILYYEGCMPYLRYDYLETVLEELNYASMINACLGDNDQLKNVLHRRHIWITDSRSDFTIISVCGNIGMFYNGWAESKPWKEEKINIEFKKFIHEHCTNLIVDYTIDYLNQNDNASCDCSDVEYHILGKLKNDPVLKSGKYKFVIYDNKIVLDAIFQVFIL